MKVFDRDYKVNFVDDNNVLVGFDYSKSCCESFGWALLNEPPTIEPETGENGIDPDGYQFDTGFFSSECPHGIFLDEGGTAMFRLTKDDSEIFLFLWNCHNGYYGHGFDMTADGKMIHDGIL